MQQRNAARELGLVVAFVAVLVHWLDSTPALVASILVVMVAGAGAASVFGEWRPWRMPLIPMTLPVLAAFSITGIARIVNPVPWLGFVFVVGWAVVAWVMILETAPEVTSAPEPAAPVPPSAVAAAVAYRPPTIRMRPKPRAEFDLPQIVAEQVVVTTPELGPHPHPLGIRAAALGLAFLGFTAAAGLVPGGFALGRGQLTTMNLIEYILLNAVVAGAVGYRLAALRSPHHYDRVVRVVAFGQCAVPVAVASAILRTLALPLFFIPGLLTVVTYLVSTVRESPEPATQNEQLLRELAVLGVSALLVVIWGLLAR